MIPKNRLSVLSFLVAVNATISRKVVATNLLWQTGEGAKLKITKQKTIQQNHKQQQIMYAKRALNVKFPKLANKKISLLLFWLLLLLFRKINTNNHQMKFEACEEHQREAALPKSHAFEKTVIPLPK